MNTENIARERLEKILEIFMDFAFEMTEMQEIEHMLECRGITEEEFKAIGIDRED